MDAGEQERIVWDLDPTALRGTTEPSDRLVFSHYFKPVTLEQSAAGADPHSVGMLQSLLQSEIGWLFLDRTRIRPVGFALGEHVQSLSLAPGEELVVEQKTFTKRERTFEEQSEQERQFDLELSSTLSTELSEGLDREASRNEQTGYSAGGSVGGNIKGVDVKAEGSYSKNITEASSQAQRRSVKDSQSSSARVASKYRAMHKTTFKISAEDRFESTSKRVIRNPNPHTPIDLHYYKVLQRLELTQERFGARLAWAFSVKDPASNVVLRLETGRRQIIDRALAAVQLPKKPEPPVLPSKPAKPGQSAVKEADKWGLTGDMSADYDLSIPIPSGYFWPDDLDGVRRATRVWGRPPDNMGWSLVGAWVDGGNLIVRVHVGAGSWIGGPKVYIQAGATFLPVPPQDDPAYQQAYAQYQAALLKWEADVAAVLDGPRAAAEEAADAWAAEMLRRVDPAIELMDQIAKEKFRGPHSDEAWEVSLWAQVFDWEHAGVSLAPSWWSDQPARDYLRSPVDFLNASWATLYLPAKPGFEKLALRWIIGKVKGGALDAKTEAAIQRLVDDLAQFRTTAFGDPLESPVTGERSAQVSDRSITMGRWSELLPTDGTHLEVLQGMTTAADLATAASVDRSHQLSAALVAEQEQDAELKRKAVDLATTAKDRQLAYNVDISVNGNGSPPLDV